jgi:hypothetical protein
MIILALPVCLACRAVPRSPGWTGKQCLGSIRLFRNVLAASHDCIPTQSGDKAEQYQMVGLFVDSLPG